MEGMRTFQGLERAAHVHASYRFFGKGYHLDVAMRSSCFDSSLRTPPANQEFVDRVGPIVIWSPISKSLALPKA